MNEDLENEEKKETTGSKVRSKATNKVKEKVQKKLSSSLKKNAVKQTALKAIMPILPYILLFVLAVIIIVGIVMFLITMPGMVMDQLKELARVVGDSVASWFGEDDTKQITDEQVYETLDYLEQMGYDLKGYGFLTDYVGDDDDGVERDENDDTITNAESDFVTTYLVSDNYVYTIKNFNMVAEGFLAPAKAFGQHIASLFTGGRTNQYWSRGMIEIRLDKGKLGNKGTYYAKRHRGEIVADPQARTLEIKRGWGNNSMTYNLDGWTGRYGMPIDFLLSIHLATMMPDLAYDMATGFETVICLLLHPVGGGETGENTAVGYYKVGENEYISYDEFKDSATSGVTGPINSWKISKKEAMEIFRKHPELKSPENCTGTADVGEDPIEIDGKTETSNTIDLDRSDEQEVVNTYNAMINKFKEYGFTSENATEELPESISSFEEFKNLQEVLERNESIPGAAIYYYYEEDSRESEITVTWLSPDDNYATYTANIYLGFSNYMMTNTGGGTSTTSYFHNAKINYSITGEWTAERVNEWLKENNLNVEEEARCSSLVDEKEECCSACRNYLQDIYDELKDPDVEHLDIYQPYIADVTDHWYRDIYFVSDANQRFVDYDYEYEAIMKERWTKYETYDDGELAGEYKLYKVDENGELTSELYDGTSEDAAEEGIAVAKKAETILISDEADNLEWHEAVDNKIAAYEIDNETSEEEMQPAYPDVTEDDAKYEIKKNVYVGITTTGTIKQTGEGQRTETNAKIKKMFLQNEYFRYDGSTESAEIITKLRKKIDSSENYYGPVAGIDNDGKEVDYTDISIEEDGTEYTVADFSGKVNLNQDSLNAFSMLENTHTLDADYIYRDFKELIVELGFFEKEELTDETPRLLQWLIPDIGSYQYPAREIDKNEHEFGTMIHSKGDIEANEKNTIYYILQNISEDEDPELKNSNTSLNATNTSSTSAVSAINNKSITQTSDKGFDLINTVGNATNQGEKECSEVSVDEFLEKSKEIMDYMMENNFRYYSHPGGGGIGALKSTWQEGMVAKNVCCATYVSWVLEEIGVMSGHTNSCEGFFPWIIEVEGAEVISSFEDLEAGDILFYSDTGQGWVTDANASNGSAHVDIFYGWESEPGGNYYIYSAGKCTGQPCTRPCSGGGEDLRSGWSPSHSTFFAIRLPFNGTKTNVDEYEGYEGNEAVVSPVTGILLEYGTYDEEVDSVTGEEYRVNVDLKYGTGLIKSSTGGDNTGTQNGTTQDPNTTEPTTGKTQIDKVGYAKILVLDKENYKKLETALIENTRFDKSFLNSKGNYAERNDLTEEEINKEGDEWSDVDRTLYGYEEFARIYEEYGIAGNVIYIDGFSCELPDEEFDIKEQGKDSSPEGESLTKESFQKVTTSIFGSDGNVTKENKEILLDSLYEPDEIVKMASKKATAKLEAESILKEEALSSLYINGLTIIKEGTVIGRTITDRELIVDYRGENYEDYRSTGIVSSGNNANSTVESEDEVIGNYIRIIMSNTDKDIVENVEDYMKLDDGEGDASKEDQEYQAWEGDLEILAETIYLESSYGYLSTSTRFSSNQEEADFEMYCMGYSVVNKLLEQNQQYYGHLYDKNRTDMSPLAQVVTSKWYGVRDDMIAFINGGPSHYTEKELEYAEYCLTYDCTSITKPSDTALGSVSIEDGYSTTKKGTVIPRAMCQQGGYGDGAPGQSNIILVGFWDHDDSGDFNVGDELWGVDRSMEHLIDE